MDQKTRGDAVKDIRIRWRLRDDTRFRVPGQGRLTIEAPRFPDGLTLRTGGQAVTSALLRLSGGVAEKELSSGLDLDITEAAHVYHLFNRMRSAGLLVADVLPSSGNGGAICTILPNSSSFSLPLALTAAEGALRLSRFAYLHVEDGAMLLESSENSASVAVADPHLAALLFTLREPTERPADPLGGALYDLMHALGFLVPAADESGKAGPEDAWEFHDRILHSRSRLRQNLRASGGSYRFGDRMAPEPARRASHSGAATALPPAAHGGDRPLASLMATRRSAADMGETPVTLAEISALFERVARVRGVNAAGAYEGRTRPIPSGGAIAELEFYLAVRACDALVPGFYHYDGHDHTLVEVPGGQAAAARMVGDTARFWPSMSAPPQCVLVITSRLPRIAFKYEGIAYRLTLLNTGAALMAFLLACEDLSLQARPIGSYASSVFEEATGVSSWVETSVAEIGFGHGPTA